MVYTRYTTCVDVWKRVAMAETWRNAKQEVWACRGARARSTQPAVLIIAIIVSCRSSSSRIRTGGSCSSNSITVGAEVGVIIISAVINNVWDKK